jgi:hypothetical protein
MSRNKRSNGSGTVFIKHGELLRPLSSAVEFWKRKAAGTGIDRFRRS